MPNARKPDLLKKVFRQYLLPLIILSLATSLSMFVDAIVVSALLGSNALAIVNMGMPITLTFTTVSILLGVGGSHEYARLLGERELAKATSLYEVSMLALGVLSVVFLVTGLAVAPQLAASMTSDTAILGDLGRYLHTLSLCAIPFMLVTGHSYFLTAAGHPNQAMALAIVANVINIAMDFGYIRGLEMGVWGAALATFTGYLVAFVIAVFMEFATRSRLVERWSRPQSLRPLVAVCSAGAATALGQLGFVCKYSSMNALANANDGTRGVVVFSLCMQTLLITSLFQAGVTQCTMPIISTLRGERDESGVRIVISYAMRFMAAFSIALVALFELAPWVVTDLYSIQGAELLEMSFRGIRIFSVVHLLRTFAMLLMYYFTAIGRNGLAVTISAIDSFLVIPTAFVLSRFLGIDGIWLAFPLSGVLCLLCILVATTIENRRSHGATEGIFLFETTRDVPTLDMTVKASGADAVSLSRDAIGFAREQGCTSRAANLLGLLAEEMTDYIAENSEKDTDIDVLVRVFDDRVCLFFRSDGKPLSALNAVMDRIDGSNVDGPATTSVAVLRTVAHSMEYERLLGMNSTTLVLDR